MRPSPYTEAIRHNAAWHASHHEGSGAYFCRLPCFFLPEQELSHKGGHLVSEEKLTTAIAIEQQTDKDVLIAEYQALRDEINTNSQVASNAATVAVTATVAFITFGLGSRNWAVFLAPALLIIVSVIFVTSQYTSTARIAAYIRRRHEEGDLRDLKWESALNEIRQVGKDSGTINFILSLSVTFLLLTLACVGLSIFYFVLSYGSPLTILAHGQFSQPLVFSVILIVGWGVLLALALRAIYQLNRCFSGKNFELHYNNWDAAFKELAKRAANGSSAKG